MQTPQSNLTRITTIIKAWENLRPNKSFAGLTLDEYKRFVQPSLDSRARIAKLRWRFVAEHAEYDIISELRASGLQDAGDAASAIENGWEVSEFKEASVDELLRTYSIRLDHIRAMRGVHAEQLARATGELVDRLGRATRVQSAFIRGDAEHHFVVFRDPVEATVVGVLRVVSKLDISSERWRRLWKGCDSEGA